MPSSGKNALIQCITKALAILHMYVNSEGLSKCAEEESSMKLLRTEEPLGCKAGIDQNKMFFCCFFFFQPESIDIFLITPRKTYVMGTH